MKKKYPKLICAFAAAILCFTGGMLAAEPRSASAAETSGNWGKHNITLKNVTSSIEIKNIVSNPVTYKDNAENGTLVSASETVNTSVMTGSQTVIFTAAILIPQRSGREIIPSIPWKKTATVNIA